MTEQISHIDMSGGALTHSACFEIKIYFSVRLTRAHNQPIVLQKKDHSCETIETCAAQTDVFNPILLYK